MKQAKKTIAARIAEKTGLSTYRSQKALQAALGCIKQALGDGKQVDLGELGKLVVVERKPTRKIVNYLKGRRGKGQKEKTIGDLYQKHPRTVRLLGRGRDLSENPQPTIVHKKAEPEPVSTRRFAIARPSFRGRPNMPRRRAT